VQGGCLVLGDDKERWLVFRLLAHLLSCPCKIMVSLPMRQLMSAAAEVMPQGGYLLLRR
jgi:hypothetical protein